MKFHERQPQAGCPLHPWPCGIFDVHASGMMHMMPSMDVAVWPAHCLQVDVQAEGLWSQDQLAEWIAEATLAQGPGGFGWQRQRVKLCTGAAEVEKTVVSAFTDQTRVINNYCKGLNWGLYAPEKR